MVIRIVIANASGRGANPMGGNRYGGVPLLEPGGSSQSEFSDSNSNALLLRQPSSGRDSADFSFEMVFRVLRKRKWSVIGSMLLLFSLALGASLYMTPKYEAISTIEMNKENFDTLGLDNLEQLPGRGADALDYNVTLQTQMNVLQSDSLLFQVVTQLGLEKRKEFTLSPSYFDSNQVIKELTLPLEKSPLRRDQIHKTFEKELKVKNTSGTPLIEIHFRSPDPQVAADVVNTLVNDYLDQNYHTRYAATARASEWLGKQLGDLKSQIDRSQQKLTKMQKEAGVLGADEPHNMVITKLDELNKQLTAAEATRILKETVYQLAKSGNPELISAMASSSLMKAPVQRQIPVHFLSCKVCVPRRHS
jgi:polysaccharide biosynthesis transport protein